MSTIELNVTSAELRIQEDSLLEDGQISVLLGLTISDEFAPPALADFDLKQANWYAEISARDEASDNDNEQERIGTLRCRTTGQRRSCWLELVVSPARFEALRVALVCKNPISKVSISSTSLDQTKTWEGLSQMPINVDGVEISLPLVTMAGSTGDA